MFRFVQDSSKWPKHKHTPEKIWRAVDMHRLQDCIFWNPKYNLWNQVASVFPPGFFLLLFQRGVSSCYCFKVLLPWNKSERQTKAPLLDPSEKPHRSKQKHVCEGPWFWRLWQVLKKKKKKVVKVLPVKHCPNTTKESNEKCVAQGQVQWKGARKQLAVFTAFGTQSKLHEQRS